jgi:hypothetical protein
VLGTEDTLRELEVAPFQRLRLRKPSYAAKCPGQVAHGCQRVGVLVTEVAFCTAEQTMLHNFELVLRLTLLAIICSQGHVRCNEHPVPNGSVNLGPIFRRGI